ncbi:MAG TPA: protein kinase [Acidimicrobiales bacterium]|nr:protein kinase [Acidimicrobiales bacterium]
MPDTLPLVDRVLAGRYRLTRPIARGGMAEVWEGYDEVLARRVAVKVLYPHLAVDEAFKARFRLEAQAAARLAHPGIVATYDTGSDGDLAFIVMELVRGRTLRDAIAEAGRLPPAVAVPIAAEVADALEHAHREGLVHRDVKPANILLVEHDGATAPVLGVKVADFGIAKLQADSSATAADLTNPGALVGTARYLSPEQVQGRTPDARSDVYGLGVVLYEMLCGTPPFAADTELATALLHVREEPPALSSNDGAIPPPLEAVVLRALAKDPADRYPTAAALRTALNDVDLEPDDAVPLVVREPTPPSGVPAVARPPRRRWGPPAVVGVLALVALVLAVLAFSHGGGGGGRATPTTAAAGTPVRVAAAHGFDPLGDGSENDDQAHLVTDGNPTTTWNTQHYNTRAFGGLKPGVGLVLELAGPADLASLHVDSATDQWAAAVYVADSPASSLAGWGQPVAQASGIRGDADFDLAGRRGAAVLLWITDPGTSNRAEIGEVLLRRR